LSVSSRSRHLDVAQLFLENGANADARDKGHTPLCLASERGKPAVARVLLGHGADTKARKKDNQTPLHQANTKEVVQILPEHKADASALDIKNQTPLHRSSKHGHVGAA
jgi:ankyrin repeat protein